MKGAHRDPVDHSRTCQPRAGESFIDTLWLPGLGLIMLGTAMIAGFVAATAYGRTDLQLPLGLIAGALVTAARSLSRSSTTAWFASNASGMTTIRCRTCTPNGRRSTAARP